MKVKLFASLFMAAMACLAQAGPEAAKNPGFSIISPDHPETWEVGFNDKVSQALRWSETERRLLLDVTYSRITYTDTIPPSDFKTYTVTFPNVSMDSYGNLFVLNSGNQKIIIGSRTRGPFGRQVTLNKGVDLSAHRRDGRLNAMLVIKNTR